MALDFPNSPTLGQLFTSGALTWRWDGAKWVAATLATGLYFPNKFINPFLEIDQANEGASVNVATTIYVVDGLGVGTASIGTVTGQRSTNAPTGYPNSVMFTVSAAAPVVAGTVLIISHKLEGDDIVDTGFGTANAQNVSVAFWLRASVAGIYSAALRNSASNRSYVFAVNISAANTWQLFTQVIPGDTSGTWVTSGNGFGMEFTISPAAGSTFQTATLNTWVTGNFIASSGALNSFTNTAGATFQVGPAGLWVAPAPQPLLRTSIQAELARCQRYYEKSYDLGAAIGALTPNGSWGIYVGAGVANATNAGGTTITYKGSKRATPTVAIYSTATGAAGKIRDVQAAADINANAGSGGAQGFFLYGSTVAAGNTNLQAHWTADARL